MNNYSGQFYTSFTATPPHPPCKHGTGWFVVVRFWIFRKRVYVCSDCGKVIEGVK